MSTVKSKKLQVGTDATSSNNFTIYQPATPDGTLRIGVGNADSPTEVGQFNSNGYVATNAPAFSASQSTTTSMSNGVRTKLQFDTEDFDTNSCYDATTNYRFTPNVEGYYLITGACAFNLASGQMNVVIYKNGSALIWGNQFPNNTNLNIANVSTILYANGTTDYFECYGYQASGGTASNFVVSERFQGILVRAA